MSLANPLHPPLPSEAKSSLKWSHLPGASLGLALSSLIQESKRPIIIITPDSITAIRLEYEIQFFQQADFPIMHFPDWETLPYDHFSPHQDIISSRLAALYKLPSLQQGTLITPITTLMQRIAPRDYLDAHLFLLDIGDRLNIDETRHRLERAGYRNVPQVSEHGEFAIRGSIIDLFPMGSKLPYRIDLFDDVIDSIRTFSSETQRSMDKVEKIELLPAKEFPLTDEAIEKFRQQWRSQFSGNPLNCPLYQDISEGICTPGIEYYLPLFFDQTSTLFDYLPENSLIVRMGDIHKKADEFWEEITNRYKQRSSDITQPILTPEQVFVPTSNIFSLLKKYSTIQVISEENDASKFTVDNAPALPVDHKAHRPLGALEDFLKNYSGRILFCAETAGRREVLLQLFTSIHLHPKNYSHWHDFLNDTETYGIIIAALDEGLALQDPSLTIIAESQLFGKRVMQRRRRKVTVQDTEAIIKDLTELQVGAPIVHIDHGVGRYLGLQTLTVGEQLTEFLTIEYLEGAKLYVPVASLHLISRYSGIDPEQAPLNRLGTDHWRRAKRKAAEQVRDVAAELLDIYARREAHSKQTYTASDGQLTAFAEGFPFEETPDQQQAIDQVVNDMLSEKPMDRLVCGDVGFGKTEVAMRAAFLAVQNSRQVAILVPTTLLAQQHFQNKECEFGYRDSIFKSKCKDQYFITHVTLRLSKKPSYHVQYAALKEALHHKNIKKLSLKVISDAVIDIRRSKLPDPNSIGNAGSFFKNPVIRIQQFTTLQKKYPTIPYFQESSPDWIKIPAAWLIEQCGWKGKKYGNVGVHDKQALVLVNYGNGNGADIWLLAQDVQKSVFEQFGIQLTPEVNIL